MHHQQPVLMRVLLAALKKPVTILFLGKHLGKETLATYLLLVQEEVTEW